MSLLLVLYMPYSQTKRKQLRLIHESNVHKGYQKGNGILDCDRTLLHFNMSRFNRCISLSSPFLPPHSLVLCKSDSGNPRTVLWVTFQVQDLERFAAVSKLGSSVRPSGSANRTPSLSSQSCSALSCLAQRITNQVCPTAWVLTPSHSPTLTFNTSHLKYTLPTLHYIA